MDPEADAEVDIDADAEVDIEADAEVDIDADAAKITSSPLLTKASRSSLLLLLSADHEK